VRSTTAGAPRKRTFTASTQNQALIDALDGVPPLTGLLLCGAGLRLLECCRLRIQDVDFAANQVTIRAGKGGKDRTTMRRAS
jgi:integrase